MGCRVSKESLLHLRCCWAAGWVQVLCPTRDVTARAQKLVLTQLSPIPSVGSPTWRKSFSRLVLCSNLLSQPLRFGGDRKAPSGLVPKASLHPLCQPKGSSTLTNNTSVYTSRLPVTHQTETDDTCLITLLSLLKYKVSCMTVWL